MFLTNICRSQIPDNYPFKTYMDANNNLYMTGDSAEEIITTKFNLDLSFNWSKVFHNPGFDRGMDIVSIIDPSEVTYVAGYKFDNSTNSTDIIILKYDNFGNIIWSKKFDNPFFDDKAYAITIDEFQNIYIGGYINAKYQGKNFTVLKYSDDGLAANLVYQYTYNNPTQNSDDAATDILIDHNYLYAVGYTDNGVDYKNDVMMVSFLLENPDANVLSIKELRGNDTPTGAILVNIPPANPQQRLAKSRATITGITDMYRSGNSQDFFTMMFDNDDLSSLRWLRYFRSPANGTDIPTSITKDKFDNVYVTGYSFVNNNNPFDFATIKYNNNGSFGWDGTGVRYFDYNSQSGDDKATSIKTHFDSVYIAGPCQNASNGFYIAKYAQISGIIINQWDRVFTPAFTNSMTPPLFQTAAKMEIDTLGNVYLISFSWNASESHFAIRKYDANGNELFTYDNSDNSDNSGDSFTENNNLETDNFKIENNVNEFSLSQNYPNPFNPTTNLEFTCPPARQGISPASLQGGELGFVSLKVYDVLGNEVKTLVNENKPAGSYEVEFDGSNLPSGIYFYRLVVSSSNSLSTEGFSDTKRMILVK